MFGLKCLYRVSMIYLGGIHLIYYLYTPFKSNFLKCFKKARETLDSSHLKQKCDLKYWVQYPWSIQRSGLYDSPYTDWEWKQNKSIILYILLKKSSKQDIVMYECTHLVIDTWIINKQLIGFTYNQLYVVPLKAGGKNNVQTGNCWDFIAATISMLNGAKLCSKEIFFYVFKTFIKNRVAESVSILILCVFR